MADDLSINTVGTPDRVGSQDASVVLNGGVLQLVALGHHLIPGNLSIVEAALEETSRSLGHDLLFASLNGGGALAGGTSDHLSLALGLLRGHLLGVSLDASGEHEQSGGGGSELHLGGLRRLSRANVLVIECTVDASKSIVETACRDFL